MAGIEVENFLAALYTNASLRNEFLQRPDGVLDQFALTPLERQSLLKIDRPGLAVAGDFYGAARARYERWMHECINTVHAFDDLVDTEILRSASRELRHVFDQQRLLSDREEEHAPGVRDLVPFELGSRANQEYLLQDRLDAVAVNQIWLLLKDSALKNHLLLRCAAVRLADGGVQLRHLQDRQAGNYVAYIGLDQEGVGACQISVVISKEHPMQSWRYPLRPGTVVIVSAALQQEIEITERLSAGVDLAVLTYNTLAAIQ